MIKLFFTGDIINKENSNQNIVSDELFELIKKHDIKCCNFEAPIIDNTNANTIKKAGPVHCQTSNSTKRIIDMGFNMFSIANNHIMDYGEEGLKNTLKFLKDKIVLGAGLSNKEAYSTYVYEKDDIKIGFLSVAENGFGASIDENKEGYAWMFSKEVESNVKDLKGRCDYVIMNCHAGAELFEYPLPEIKETYRKFIDMGVDIIIGHHPHIIQGYENYKNGIIFYSLGNFIFSNTKKIECKKSYCVSIILDKEKYNFSILPTIFDNGQVDLNQNEEELDKIEKLSEEINDENYKGKIENFCIDMYNKVYKKYYLASFGINKDSIKSRIKTGIKIFFNLERENELLLYHNLAIETHYWICKRALSVINKL